LVYGGDWDLHGAFRCPYINGSNELGDLRSAFPKKFTVGELDT
jgi:hypothetical protein